MYVVSGKPPGNPGRAKVPGLVERALALDPANAKAYAAMAMYLQGTGDHAGCVANTRKAVQFENEPGSRGVYANVGGQCADAAGDVTAAIEFWTITGDHDAITSKVALAQALAKANTARA